MFVVKQLNASVNSTFIVRISFGISTPQVPSFQAGDKVRILSDKQLVQNLQQGHGGWNEKMTTVSLGSYGGYDTSLFLCYSVMSREGSSVNLAA